MPRRRHVPPDEREQFEESSPPRKPRKRQSFVVMRHAALASIDSLPWEEAKQHIVAFYEMSETPLPPTDDAIIAAIHQQRVGLQTVYPEMAKKSKKWLAAHGYGG